MIRRAFTMRLKPDALAEYKHQHDHIWPELVSEIGRSGIASITTFQRGLDLFLISEIEDEDAWDKLWNSEVHRRWAEVMEPLMHLREDGIVDSDTLTEVFHLTTGANGSHAAASESVTALEQMVADAVAHVDQALEQTESDPAPALRKTRKPSPKKSSKKAPAKKSSKPAQKRSAKTAKKSTAKKKPAKKPAPKKVKPAAKKKSAKKKKR